MRREWSLALALGAWAGGAGIEAQESVRSRIAAIRYPELRFSPVEADARQIRGVPVYFLEDRALPLVTLYAVFEGGVRNFPREYLAAATAVPALMRTGGTHSLPPDSVDRRIEALALTMSFGQGGGSASSWVNTLTDHLDDAVALWTEMLRRPRFDSAQVELWRGAALERVRRRSDDPASLAFSRFNRIMYGDHPVGWEMNPSDLEPADLAPARLRHVHGTIVCPGNLVLGVTGDISWERATTLLEPLIADWPPCPAPLPEPPRPAIRTAPGVFVLHRELEQSVIVMAHSSSVRQGDHPAYFASRIGDAILGGSGLSSRLSTRLRTAEGYAYGASSLWTTPGRDDGLVGALTRTGPATTLAATRLLLETIDSMRVRPPSATEVTHTIDEIANGFVFNFQTPFQIVARRMAYRRLGLPDDWLERYLAGIAAVEPDDILELFRREVDPARMTILLVGDTTRFDASPTELGPIIALPPDR